VARTLGPDGRGHLSVLLTASTFLSMGLGHFCSSNTVLLGRYPARLKALLLNSALWSVSSIAFLATILAVLPGRFIQLLLGQTHPEWLVLFGAVLAFQISSGALTGLLLGQQDFYFTNYASIVNGLAVLGLNAILIVWLRLGVSGALTALAIGWVAAACMASWRLMRLPDWNDCKGELSIPLFRDGVVIGSRAILSNLPSLLLLRSDVFLVQHYLGPAPVGVYTVAVNVAEMVLVISSTLNTIAFAKASSETASETSVIRSAKFSLFAGVTFWAFLALTAWWLFPLAYGIVFEASIVPCLIMMAGVSAWGFSSPLAGYIVGKEGYPRTYMAATWMGFLTNLILNIILIPHIGITGAALATAIAYSATTVVVLALFIKSARVSLRSVLIPNDSDVGMIAQGYGYLKNRCIPAR